MSGMNLQTPKDALRAAIEYYGSQTKLADVVGVKQPSIAGALLRGKASKSLALKIHKATRGRVPKSRLRPDLFGDAR